MPPTPKRKTYNNGSMHGKCKFSNQYDRTSEIVASPDASHLDFDEPVYMYELSTFTEDEIRARFFCSSTGHLHLSLYIHK